MCTKGCYTVLTCSKPFWGQFWGQICEMDSDSHRSNKCAALVSLRNMNTSITGFSQVKSPKNQYISFILQQEVVRKPTLHHPSTPPLSPRETPLFGRVRSASSRWPARPYTALNPPLSGDFLFYRKGIYLNGILPSGSSARYNLLIRHTGCILLRGRADELAEDAGEILFIGGKADGFSQLCHFRVGSIVSRWRAISMRSAIRRVANLSPVIFSILRLK